jgi:hypothetical protein
MSKYVVTVNRPGYLPEAEPVECETLAEAQEALRAELDHTAGGGAEREPGYAEAIERAAVAGPGEWILFAGFVHMLDKA